MTPSFGFFTVVVWLVVLGSSISEVGFTTRRETNGFVINSSTADAPEVTRQNYLLRICLVCYEGSIMRKLINTVLIFMIHNTILNAMEVNQKLLMTR
jgi:hypothetical protein